MGFLAKLKQMFSSNIVYNSEEDVDLGVLYRNKTTKLKKGAFVLIEDKATCIVVHKGEITDFLYGKGKFRIAQEDMPKLFARAVTPKNEKEKIIKADLYFIKATAVEKFVFFSGKPFIIKSREYGKVSGNVEGLCSVTVTSVQDLFNWLFMIRRHFKTGKIDQIIAEQIGNTVCRALEKAKINVKDMVLRNANVKEYLNIELENAFEPIGLEVRDFDLKGIQFHKKFQDKINAIIQREYEKIDKNQTKYITINMNSAETSSEEKEEELILPNENSDIVCHNCGKSMDRGYRFCPHCGARRE